MMILRSEGFGDFQKSQHKIVTWILIEAIIPTKAHDPVIFAFLASSQLRESLARRSSYKTI